MNSTIEHRLTLENFHRHFIRTHKKEEAAGIIAKLEEQAKQSARPLAMMLAEWMKDKYPQNGFHDDNWYVREIPLARCYFAHTDFRLYPVPKDQRFVDFLPAKRVEIEAGSFPCASEIRAPWTEAMPEPLVQEREPQKFYILDGQLRVIRHWYHEISKVGVYIYRGNLGV